MSVKNEKQRAGYHIKNHRKAAADELIKPFFNENQV